MTGVLMVPRAAGEAEDRYVQVLAKYRVQPAPKDLEQFLNSFNDPALKSRAAALIEQLGDASYEAREQATTALIAMSFPPSPELERAVSSDDLEIRYRAQDILEKVRMKNQEQSQVLWAVMKLIQVKEHKGLAPGILRALPFCRPEYVELAARDAMRVTARPEDAELLRKASRDPHPSVRSAAVLTLGSLSAKENLDEFRKYLVEKDEPLRLAAAEVLANGGDRVCLQALVDLLGSEDLRTRHRSAQVLQALTRQNFGFAPWAGAEERQKAVSAWRQWVAKDGATAPLHFPLKMTDPEIGRTLLCLQQGKVIELDLTGAPVWEANVARPWGCAGLPDGHRLVASHGSNAVFEFDETGKIVWQKQGLPAGPTSIQRLPNGNTLVACTDSQKVFELRPDGEVAWQADVQGRPFDAQRLPDGVTLVTLIASNRVVEISPEGKEVWQIGGLNSPQGAQRLENGNTLVADHGPRRAAEYDRSGKLVWSVETPSNVFDAQRLSSGNTLVTDGNGVREVDPAGTVIWEFKQGGICRARRY
jgi:hypothetical protein